MIEWGVVVNGAPPGRYSIFPEDEREDAERMIQVVNSGKFLFSAAYLMQREVTEWVPVE